MSWFTCIPGRCAYLKNNYANLVFPVFGYVTSENKSKLIPRENI